VYLAYPVYQESEKIVDDYLKKNATVRNNDMDPASGLAFRVTSSFDKFISFVETGCDYAELVKILIDIESSWTAGYTYLKETKTRAPFLQFSSLVSANMDQIRTSSKDDESQKSKMVAQLLICKYLEGKCQTLCEQFADRTIINKINSLKKGTYKTAAINHQSRTSYYELVLSNILKR